MNSLYEEAKLKHIEKVLGDLRNELKTLIENQFKESCHKTSRRKQSNDDAMALLKEGSEYLKWELMEKIS